MSLLVVGSIALDSVVTSKGETRDALGGSALFFSVAGSLLHPVQVVGVVGTDYPTEALDMLASRGVDLTGVERAKGESFRWKGSYSADFATRATLELTLGVFADFRPTIPGAFSGASYVFLGNIDPELQFSVLDQVHNPTITACDTIDFWIRSKREALLKLLERIDILMLNDSEARELSGEWNLHRAAAWILERGPKMTVIKKGEHGAVLVSREQHFFVPGFPVLDVRDPTGAGDCFAGGFMAYLASSGEVTLASLRRAMVYGSAMGAFAVEDFAIGRFENLAAADVHDRVRSFHRLVHFDVDGLPE